MKDHYYPSGYQQIREAIVREIRDAERWCAVEEAWLALLHVRQMADSMAAEAMRLDPHRADLCCGSQQDKEDGR